VLGLILRTKDPQKALKYLESSSKSPAYELASHLLLADIQADLGSYREASASALRALKIADAESVPADEAEELIQLYEPIFEGQTHIESADDLKYLYETINQQLERPDWREYIKSARKQLPLQPEGSPPLPLAELLFETSNTQIVESLGLIRKLASEGKYRTAMEEAFHALSFAPVYLPLHVQWEICSSAKDAWLKQLKNTFWSPPCIIYAVIPIRRLAFCGAQRKSLQWTRSFAATWWNCTNQAARLMKPLTNCSSLPTFIT